MKTLSLALLSIGFFVGTQTPTLALATNMQVAGCIRLEYIISIVEAVSKLSVRHHLKLEKVGLCQTFDQGTEFLPSFEQEFHRDNGWAYTCVIPVDKTVCFWVPSIALVKD